MVKDYPLDITAVPFSRRNAGGMIFYETNGAAHDAENGLYLSQSTEGVLMGGAQFYRNKNYLLITPMQNGVPVRYTYAASTSKVCIECGEGKIEITFSRDGGMRIRAFRTGIRFTAKMGFGDVAMLQGSAAQVEMDGTVYYMVPVKGSVSVDSHYNLLTYRYTDPVIDFESEKDELELVIFDRKTENAEVDGTFEDCVQKMQEDFALFMSRVVAVPEGLEQLLYSLWIAEKPFENTKMYPSNVIDAVYPIAEEQPILALAFAEVEKSSSLITNFAPYATDKGLIPKYVRRGKAIYQTSSINYGYASLQLLKRGTLSETQLVKIYDMLATVDSWWSSNRSSDGGKSFYYAYRYECGHIENSLLSGGTPAVTPDLMAKMTLMAEALAEYAEKLGEPEASDKWRAAAGARRKYLFEKLWNKNRFLCRLADGTEFESDSLLCWMPVILGEGLPADIGATAAENIAGFLVNGRGLRMASGEDEIDTAETSLIAAGLWEAGQKETARRILEALMQNISVNGLYAKYPANTEPEKRCGGLYPPAACAAVLYVASKIL